MTRALESIFRHLLQASASIILTKDPERNKAKLKDQMNVFFFLKSYNFFVFADFVQQKLDGQAGLVFINIIIKSLGYSKTKTISLVFTKRPSFLKR